MSFTSKTGSCRFRGPPGLATPFARHYCFQTAYAPGPVGPNDCECCGQNSSGLNCMRSWATRGSCYYGAECQNVGNQCFNGKCGPFESNNPRVIKTMPWSDMAAFGAAVGMGVPDLARGQNMILVNDGSGQPTVAVPLNVSRTNQSEPQCSTCLKTVWNCEKYRNLNQKQEYETCKRFEKCFLYDTVREDGTLIPVAVRMTPECFGAANAAVKKCATRCGNCVPFDGLAKQA